MEDSKKKRIYAQFYNWIQEEEGFFVRIWSVLHLLPSQSPNQPL